MVKVLFVDEDPGCLGSGARNPLISMSPQQAKGTISSKSCFSTSPLVARWRWEVANFGSFGIVG